MDHETAEKFRAADVRRHAARVIPSARRPAHPATKSARLGLESIKQRPYLTGKSLPAAQSHNELATTNVCGEPKRRSAASGSITTAR